MLIASITGSLTDQITSLIGNHGVEAVFGLTALAAILPTGGELVMLYAGALAAGAFSQSVVVFGHHVDTRSSAYLTVVAAGIAGDTLGSLFGWAIGIFGGRPLLERHGRWLHLSHERLERAEHWFERFGSIAVPLGRITPFAARSISFRPACSGCVSRSSLFSPRSPRSSGAFASLRSALRSARTGAKSRKPSATSISASSS